MDYQEMEQAVSDLQDSVSNINDQLDTLNNTDLSRVGQLDFPIDPQTAQEIDQEVDDHLSSLSGQTTLVAGTVTINNANVYTSSIILISRFQGYGTLGYIQISAQYDGSFTIISSSATDTSSINYLIIN